MVEIKELTKFDIDILEEFIYWSIFTPPGHNLPERSVIRHPSIYIYVKDFGETKGDCGVYAEIDGKAIGAAWARLIPAFGYIGDDTPELAISILPKYRSQGIGTKMMGQLFDLLIKNGYSQTSLAVQKENPAMSFYERLGYKIVKEEAEEFLMVKQLVI